MPLSIKITSETKEKGVFRATGTVTADGIEKGKATVFVQKGENGAAELVLSKDAKTTILGNEVTEYRSYDGPTAEATPELAKDVELTFSNLQFAI